MSRWLQSIANSAALRYFAIFATVLLLSSLIGLFSSQLVFRSLGEQMAERPPHFIVRLLNGLSQAGVPPAQVVEIMNREIEGILPMVFYLFDEQAQPLRFPPEPLLSETSLRDLLPLITEQIQLLETAMPAGDKLQGARLNDGTYLVMHTVKAKYNMRSSAFVPAALSFVFFLILGLVLSSLGLIIALRRRATQAAEVLEALKSGNLQARFPIKRMDEFGRGMHLFNQMAEQIESLVTQIEQREQRTRDFFVGIAHDLRTPLASLKNMQEILSEHGETLPPAQRKHFLHSSLSEVNYLAELLENMLLLSRFEQQISPPASTRISLSAVLLQVLQALAVEPIKVTVQPLPAQQDDSIYGESLLIERLWRNLLNNALEHAQNQVQIFFSQVQTPTGPELQIQITDDGPGFSEEALKSYGVHQHSRKLTPHPTSGKPRISLGLGSVIVTEIVHLHGGRLDLSNGSKGLAGAVVTLHLPQRRSASQASPLALKALTSFAWRDRHVLSTQSDAPANDPAAPKNSSP